MDFRACPLLTVEVGKIHSVGNRQQLERCVLEHRELGALSGQDLIETARRVVPGYRQSVGIRMAAIGKFGGLRKDCLEAEIWLAAPGGPFAAVINQKASLRPNRIISLADDRILQLGDNDRIRAGTGFGMRLQGPVVEDVQNRVSQVLGIHFPMQREI